jgi:hypothetical protein
MPEPVTLTLKLGVAAVFAAGVAWGTARAAASQKLDQERFVRDSIAKAATLERIDHTTQETNTRVREMWCGQHGNPPGCR